MVARPTRKRMYRTMQGKMIDMDRLRAANEDVAAVGNMNVNARGDQIGAGGKIIKPKSEVIQKYYEQPRGMVDDTPFKSKPVAQKRVVRQPQAKPVVSKPIAKTVPTPKKSAPATKKGIDAALDGIE